MNPLLRAIRVTSCAFRLNPQNNLEIRANFQTLRSAKKVQLLMQDKPKDLFLPYAIKTRQYSTKVLSKGIFRAIRENNAENLRLALELGADVNKCGYYNRFFIVSEIIREIIGFALIGPLNFFWNDPSLEMTPLMAAAMTGRIECVKVLLEFGATNHQKNWADETADIIAYEMGHYEIAKLIKNFSKANVDPAI